MKAADAPKTEAEFLATLADLPEDQRRPFEEMMRRFRPWEPLDPELAREIQPLRDGVKALRHPLVYSVPYMPGVCDGMHNDILRAKTKAVAEARAEENWSDYVVLHENPHRLDALLRIADEIKEDEVFWGEVGDQWTLAENHWQQYDEWHNVLTMDRPGRQHFMSPDERKFLRKLPATLDIFRGARTAWDGSYEATDGYSWTLSRTKALWFANRFESLHEDADTYVLHGRAAKADVIAYKEARGEKEIVVLPEHVKLISREEI